MSEAVDLDALREAARAAVGRLSQHLGDEPAELTSHQYRDALPLPGQGSLNSDIADVRAYFAGLDEVCRGKRHPGDSLRPIGWSRGDA